MFISLLNPLLECTRFPFCTSSCTYWNAPFLYLVNILLSDSNTESTSRWQSQVFFAELSLICFGSGSTSQLGIVFFHPKMKQIISRTTNGSHVVSYSCQLITASKHNTEYQWHWTTTTMKTLLKTIIKFGQLNPMCTRRVSLVFTPWPRFYFVFK